MALDTYYHGCTGRFCHLRAIILGFVGLCIPYFLSTLQNYNMSFRMLQKDIDKATDEYSRQYQKTVEVLETYIGQSMNTNAYMAEREFESKRRDFLRFVQSAFGSCQLLDQADKALLTELKGFVKLWLNIFSECSIDPSNKPLRIMTTQEVDECTSVEMLTADLAERLDITEVKFITQQRDKYKKKLVKDHQEHNRR